jgi:hypothetical protein
MNQGCTKDEPRMNQGCTTYLHNVPTEQGTVGSSGRSFHAKHGTGPSPLPPTVHTTDAFEILGAVVGAQIDDQRQHLLRIRQVVVVVAVLQRTGASAGPHVVTAPNVARVHLHRHSRVFPNVGLFQLFRRLPWPIRPRKHGVAVAVHPLQRPLRQVVVAVVHAVFQPLAVPRMAFHEWRSKNGRQNKNVKKKKERDFSKITTTKITTTNIKNRSKNQHGPRIAGPPVHGTHVVHMCFPTNLACAGLNAHHSCPLKISKIEKNVSIDPTRHCIQT